MGIPGTPELIVIGAGVVVLAVCVIWLAGKR